MATRAVTALVDTQWVADNLATPGVCVLEVDEDTEAYRLGHIPNSCGVHWRDDLQDPLRREFVGADAFALLMDRMGIANDTQVVLYGGNSNWFAAYAYWYFKYYGHEAVQLMDGGRKKWELEGRELVQEVPLCTPTTDYKVRGPVLEIRTLREQMLNEILGDKAFRLVDVRSPEESRGELQKPGHIPGARNIPWARAVDPETGEFLALDRLQALYEAEGVTPDRQVVAYCRIGERSAHTWFVLHELLNYPRVRNYDGSWTEWGSMVGVPIER
jgi:thiosulfate/3-mercaptopyruvate sulfurtransferase